MRAKSMFVVVLSVAACSFSLAAAQVNSQETKKSAGGAKKSAAVPPREAKPEDQPPAKAAEPLRLPLPQNRSPYLRKIESIGKDGLIQAGPLAPEMPLVPPEMRSDLTEGYYIGIVEEAIDPAFKGARLLRVQVTDVGEDGNATVQVAKSAATAIKEGELLILIRPIGATTAMMKKLPELAALEQGPSPGQKDQGNRLQLAQSFNNLKQIMLALHNFHDTFGHFPPAAIIGPDKKPWHSWRVMLLPYLDAADVFNQYKWDEPWNGPNNKKLLSRMPAVYADPIYGNDKEFFTHYVAITGDDAAFSTDVVEFDGEDFNMGQAPGRSFREFTDGTSNTLMVGPVGPDRKIPWMKPEDIVVGDDFPELGKKGSFALPFKTEQGNAGPFARCDGSATTILEGIDPGLFRSLITIRGNEIVDWSEVPSVAAPGGIGQMVPVIYILGDEKQPVARLSMEPSEPALMPVPFDAAPPQAIPTPRVAPPRVIQQK